MRTLAGVLAVAAVSLAGLLCAPGVAAAQSGEKVDLRLNLKPGDQRKMTADMDFDMDIQSQKVKMNMAFGMGFKVVDVDSNGDHTIACTYDRVRMKMAAGPLNIDYDSANPPEQANPLTQVFGAMVGTKLTMKVTPKGKTLKVEGLDKLAEKMGANLPESARANLENQTKGMTGSFDQMMAFLPKEPVAVGDSWKGSMDVATDPNMPMKVEATYTLKERKNGKAIVGIDGQMKGGTGLSGTMKGTMTIDEKTGWNEGGKMTLDMSGNVQGMQMKMNGKITFGN